MQALTIYKPVSSWISPESVVHFDVSESLFCFFRFAHCKALEISCFVFKANNKYAESKAWHKQSSPVIILHGHAYDTVEKTTVSVQMVMDDIELIRASPWLQQ